MWNLFIGWLAGLLTATVVLAVTAAQQYLAERRTRTPEPDTAGRIELVDMSMEETR